VTRARHILGLVLLFAAQACGGEQKQACEATYTKLEVLGCIKHYEQLVGRGCLLTSNKSLIPTDCDPSVLKLCNEELASFEQQTGAPSQPLHEFLERKCGPKGTKVIDWPEPNMDALRRAKAKADFEAETKLAADKIDQARARSVVKPIEAEFSSSEPKALSTADVSEVVSGWLEGIEHCHAAVLLADRTLAGRVTLELGVREDGSVGLSTVVPSTDEHQDFQDCITRLVRGWQFPAPGKQVSVQIPIDLAVKEL
jgi:hypothetical protein